MISYLIYLITRFLSFFFSVLPTNLALYLGKIIGEILYILYPNRKEVAYSNLISVFGHSKSTAELRYISKMAFINLAQIVVEMLRLPQVNKSYQEKYIATEGFYYIKEALRKKKGVVLLTAHFGNWELLAIIGAIQGYPMKVLAREQEPEEVNSLLNSYRESKGSEVIPKGFATREIIRALRDNEPVGILADQDAGKEGVFVNFLGRPTSTPSGAIAFALKTGAEVLPCFIRRERGPYHKVEINPPLQFDREGERKDNIREGLEKYSEVLGRYVKKYPSQWLWFHKRWKSTPPTSILILHDGKAGHLNQSRAVASALKKVLKEKYPHYPTELKEREVKFRNKLCRFMCNFYASISKRKGPGYYKYMKMFLAPEFYNIISREYADIVISCGAKVEGINPIVARQNNAKNIVIMKPSLVGLDKFDLALVPQHDKLNKSTSKIVKFPGALSSISPKRMQQGVEKLESLGYNFHEDKIKVGVLIGGDSKRYLLSPNLINLLIDQLLNLGYKFNIELLLTTSRRTSKKVDKVIKKRLEGENLCKLLVIANINNIPNVVPAILDLSDIVLVSGESISMVSEAASADTTVIVFRPQRKFHLMGRGGKLEKHQRFLNDLKRRNHIELVEINEIYKKSRDVIKGRIKTDNLEIEEMLKKSVLKVID